MQESLSYCYHLERVVGGIQRCPAREETVCSILADGLTSRRDWDKSLLLPRLLVTLTVIASRSSTALDTLSSSKLTGIRVATLKIRRRGRAQASESGLGIDAHSRQSARRSLHATPARWLRLSDFWARQRNNDFWRKFVTQLVSRWDESTERLLIPFRRRRGEESTC